MSTRELARTLLDEMPDNDLIYLVAYMQSLKALKDAEIPNAKTQAAIDEVDSMIRTGEGDHSLTGNYTGCHECHIQPDWILIYRQTDTELYLVATGTHSDLFGL